MRWVRSTKELASNEFYNEWRGARDKLGQIDTAANATLDIGTKLLEALSSEPVGLNCHSRAGGNSGQAACGRPGARFRRGDEEYFKLIGYRSRLIAEERWLSQM